MRAEIVSVGTELLLGQIVDTNAAHAGRVLAACGIDHYRRSTVGDNLTRLVGVLREALDRADVVVTIGGLGPTLDDLTRYAVAEAIDDTLVNDQALEAEIVEKLRARDVPWIPSHGRQAMRPTRARALANPNGTAPGLHVMAGTKHVFCLPGPGSEFVPMMAGPVAEVLSELGAGRVIRSQTVHIVGVGESRVESVLADLMAGEDPTVAPYAKTGEVHVRISSAEVTETGLAAVADEIVARLGTAVYSVGGQSLEEVVLGLVESKGCTLAVAESCTGGGLGARLSSVPGSSRAFLGGVISYANSVKEGLLGVPKGVLETEGAVSEACARSMAEGVRSATGADYGVSITGIAGPDGGSRDRPVGLVYIGVSGPAGTDASRHLFAGTRDSIRARSVQSALIGLRESVLSES